MYGYEVLCAPFAPCFAHDSSTQRGVRTNKAQTVRSICPTIRLRRRCSLFTRSFVAKQGAKPRTVRPPLKCTVHSIAQEEDARAHLSARRAQHSSGALAAFHRRTGVLLLLVAVALLRVPGRIIYWLASVSSPPAAHEYSYE